MRGTPRIADGPATSPGTGRKLSPGVPRALRDWQEREWFGYVLILPCVALIALIVLYPVAQGIYLSFTNASVTSPIKDLVGFQNYQTLFGDSEFFTSLKNSVIITAWAVVLELVLGMGLALLLSQDVPGIRAFRSLTMASWVIPVIASVMMFQLMVQPHSGLFNIILDHVGLKSLDVYWFGSTTLAMPSVILMHVWRNVPFFGIALLAAIQGIPTDLFEAAELDGASPFARFRTIIVPATAPIAMIMVIIHVLWTFNNFEFVFLSTGGGPIDDTMVLPIYVYRQFWQNFQTGLAAAGGVVILLILLVFTIGYVLQARESGAPR
jgi:multiple sugar transport system permease protein